MNSKYVIMDEFGAAHQIFSINSSSKTSYIILQGFDLEMQKMYSKKVNMDEFGAEHQILSIDSGSQTS